MLTFRVSRLLNTGKTYLLLGKLGEGVGKIKEKPSITQIAKTLYFQPEVSVEK